MENNIVLGYSCVSSEEQAAHGISIDAQRGILEGYAAMTSSRIRIYEDAGYSGKKDLYHPQCELKGAYHEKSCFVLNLPRSYSYAGAVSF